MTENTTTETLTQDEMRKIIETVFKRAQTDAEFRKLCLDSPGEAIYQISGKRLPVGATLSFTEPQNPQAT